MSQVSIILTGFMGSGKSAVGRKLAEMTGRRFIDTDEEISLRQGRSIAEIFAEQGETAFRDSERQIAREFAGQPDLVIATGGRLMLDPLNATLLGRGNMVVCLTAEPDQILTRLAKDRLRRPLLEVPDPRTEIVRLLAERREGYGQFEQLSTDNQTPSQIAVGILKSLSSKQIKTFTTQIPVRNPTGQYMVFVGYNLLNQLPRYVRLPDRIAIVTDDQVGPIYASRLSNLEPATIITLPAGESFKTLDSVSLIYRKLLECGLDRQGAAIALGGGVIGDMTGFAAATYMRGIHFVQCPTTILAMVDASVGGKTGVDLPEGKNLIGAFKQPRAVVADLKALATLPPRQFSSGLAEVVKHGLLASSYLLEQLERLPNLRSVSKPDYLKIIDEFQSLIVEAILVKRDVVEEDPFESGLRKKLNLGHTFGHAIEHASHYHVTHGEAVAIGLVAAAHLSAELGYCSKELQTRLEALLNHLNLPTRIPSGLDRNSILEFMKYDKKKTMGGLQFVLIEDIGQILVSGAVPDAAVQQTLHTLQKIS